MGTNDIIAQIDAEIAQLQSARALLAGSGARGPGRPKKVAGLASAAKPAKKKRNLSPEGRARIAEAVKRRWAAQKAKAKQSGKG